MNTAARVYFDHAATSWPKSPAVLAAMDDFHRHCGAAAGRGAYRAAINASDLVRECRRRLAQLIAAPRPDTISFHSNGTAALNVAIAGIVRPGDHVVTTAAEHNSVLRPLAYLRSKQQVHLTVVPCDRAGLVDADDVLAAVRPETRLVAVTHVSNVTGAVQPIETIGLGLADQRALFLCDAAQSLGYLPIDVTRLKVDLLAAPGHKGAAGPLGTAMLYCAPEWHDEIEPSVHGGTGSQSETLTMPDQMPDKLEAGNLNVPALAGWNAGLAEMEAMGLEAIGQRGREITRRLVDNLNTITGVHLYGSPKEIPLISLKIEGLGTADVANILDVDFGIETRAGWHCAALVHQYLDSHHEGTLRISAGRETRDDEVDAVILAISEIANSIHA